MSRRRNTMKSFKGEDGIRNFDSTLTTLEVLKNHLHITKCEKERALAMVKGAITLLSISIEYKSFKADCEAEGLNIAEQVPQLDAGTNNDLLEDFFGPLTLPEMKEKLKVIEQKIKEVRKAIR